MQRHAFCRLAAFSFIFSALTASAQTNLVVNGSFESGLTGWTATQVNATGATGTCSYNAVTAPGTETLTSTAGFPATDGTGIVLGSVSSTTNGGPISSCTLYQDIAIPANAATITLSYDSGAKAGADNCINAALAVGIYSTSSVPGFASAALADKTTTCVSGSSATLTAKTATSSAASFAGTTVRVAIANGANQAGHEVVGVDNVQVTITLAPPTVTSVSPNSGPASGGTSVTITGTKFVGVTAVTFGGVAATSFNVVSATSITATVPAGSPGPVSVVVTTPGGSNAANTLYTYTGPPTITSIIPSSGPPAGGTAVVITGTNFTGATSVTFGGTAAASFTVLSSTVINATTPAGAAGVASVIVTTPAGANAANTLYTYSAPPTITSVNPSSGPPAGGNTVTITGTGFTGATSLTFGGTPASFTVVSATTITATVPAGAAGAASVIVTTPAGSNAANALYSYVVATPTLGQWGMIALASLLLVYAWRRLRLEESGWRL